jgi:hypothetical protein
MGVVGAIIQLLRCWSLQNILPALPAGDMSQDMRALLSLDGCAEGAAPGPLLRPVVELEELIRHFGEHVGELLGADLIGEQAGEVE